VLSDGSQESVSGGDAIEDWQLESLSQSIRVRTHHGALEQDCCDVRVFFKSFLQFAFKASSKKRNILSSTIVDSFNTR
jgi:hypothetical protein